MDAGLTIDVKKCAFEKTSVTYLGYIVDAGKEPRIDPAKIQAILEWKAPTTVKGGEGFLGFANYYRIFIPNYSKIVHPLTALTRKGTKFEWTKTCNKAFEELKENFVKDPILAPFNPEAPTRNQTYEEQDDVAALWRPVSYFAKKMLQQNATATLMTRSCWQLFVAWRPGTQSLEF